MDKVKNVLRFIGNSAKTDEILAKLPWCSEDFLISLERDGYITYSYAGCERQYTLLPRGWERLQRSKEKFYENVRYAVTTSISLAALILSLIALWR